MRATLAIALVTLSLATTAQANEVRVLCGEAPVVESEALKADLTGKASVIKRLARQPEFTGVVDATQEDILANYPDADEARTNAFLYYVACALTLDDEDLDTSTKLDAIAKLKSKLLSDKTTAIDFTYYSIEFKSIRRSGRKYIVNLEVKNTNPFEYGIAIAFAHTRKVPSCLGTLRPSCKAKVSLSDESGINYTLSEVSGLGQSRDREDWTFLYYGEKSLVSLEFDSRGYSPVERHFILDGEIIAIWRINANEQSKPSRRAFSIKYPSDE